MDFILVFFLVILSNGYNKLALKFGIIDTPNNRSSHSIATIRGGGIIFLLSTILFFIFYKFQYPFFVSGLILIAFISFLDDIYTLGSKVRLFFQLLAILLTFHEFDILHLSPLWIIFSIIIGIGLLNIYNFMDGINGMTGFYSIAILLSLLYMNIYILDFINIHLLILVLASLIIFGYSNFRKNAKSFAGDIGSISIGIILIFCISKLIIQTQNIFYSLFTLIYIIDGGVTIIERLLRRENILKPHRRHLYQLLVDVNKISHLKVSFIYSISQLIVCALTIFFIHNVDNEIPLFLIILTTFISYLIIKLKILNNG